MADAAGRPGNAQEAGPDGAPDPPAASPDLRRLRGFIAACKWDEALGVLEEDESLWHEADEDNVSHLHWAALAGAVAFVRRALGAGCPRDPRSPGTLQTPLMWAAVKGHTEVAYVLLEAGADPLAVDALGATPALLAVQYQQVPALLVLLGHGQHERQLVTTDHQGRAPAHWAAYKGEPATLWVLTYFGADLQAQDEERKTPLHRAVQGMRSTEVEPRRAEAVEMLVQQGGDPEQTDASGQSAQDVAAGKEGRFASRVRAALAGSQGDGAARDLEAARGGKVGGASGRAGKDRAETKISGPAIFWLVSVSFAAVQYITELRPTAWTIVPFFALYFELGVVASLALFFWVSRSDPGKVPPRPREEAIRSMTESLASGGATAVATASNMQRLCTATWVFKGPRTKYCKNTGACVDEFDHWCVWLNNSIGRGNHRPFVCLAAVEVSTQWCHLLLCYLVLRSALRLEDAGPLTWLSTVATNQPMTLLVCLVQSLTAPMIQILITQQLFYVAVNKTTNEAINAKRYGLIREIEVTPGSVQLGFWNPFNKGGVFANCLDFWWLQQRARHGPPGAGNRWALITNAW